MPRPNQLAVLAISLMVVTGMLLGGVNPGGSAVGTAEAATIFQDCDMSDSIVGAFLQGIVAPNEEGECRFNPDDQTDYANISATDGYQQAITIAGSNNRFFGTYENFVSDSRTIASSKAKIEIINALNNGRSEAFAKSEAKEAIDDYYSRMQRNVLADYNAKTAQAGYLLETGINYEMGGIQTGLGYENKSVSGESYTLVNGSTVAVARIKTSDSSKDSWSRTMTAHHPDTSDTVQIDLLRHKEMANHIAANHSNVRSNVDSFVTAVYSEYQSGDLDSVDLAEHDPGAIAYQAGTDANSTGYYGYTAIQLAALGAAGNINHSHTVQVLDANENVSDTVEGTLYYTGEDVTVFENNTVYNHSNLNGTVYMAAAEDDGTTAILDLGERGAKFRITSAINTKTGEAVNNTTIEQHTYKTFNASQLEEEIAKLRDLRESYERQSAGGGAGSGSGVSIELVAVVLAAIGIGVAMNRSGGGNRGRR